jgi:F420 biosynthesis protein FbiB-like protein
VRPVSGQRYAVHYTAEAMIIIDRIVECAAMGKRSGRNRFEEEKMNDLFRAPTVTKLLKDRRSVRRYTDRAISREQLDVLIDAAVRAPSAHNRQPWRFLAIPSREHRITLANSMADRLRADRTHDGDAPATIEADAARSIERITGAPLVIVACLTMADMDTYPDERRSAAEKIMAIQGTAMAIQNLLLAATAEGLGSSLMCAPLFCPETVRTVLQLPNDWEPQALIMLGYPRASAKPRERRPIQDIVRVLGDFS